MTQPINFQPDTALIVVDMQNDFADPEGSLSVEGGDKIVDTINDHVRKAKEADAPVVYTQDWHPEETPHFKKDGGVWPVHCVKETWGARFHPDLVVDGPVVRKGSNGEDGYSGFTMRDPISGEEKPTELDEILRSSNVDRVVIVGLTTDYCVKATVLDAVDLGYKVTVLGDAIRAVNVEEGDKEKALRAMEEAGATVV